MDKKTEKRDIAKKSENISDWYNDIVLRASLADYGPVRGTMVIRPYGYAIWERVQRTLDTMFKSGGVENAYFPLFIPHSLIAREKDHIEGFSPELALVTIAGGEELKDPLVVRPTSETIMYEMYSKWIQSWRDLPVKINQWNNVVRWEKRTYLFLRTSEFLWQEGHTAHATEEDAIEMQKAALEWYRKTYEEHYAIPVHLTIKSEAEKFAGAKTTYSVELLMPDGKALQGATSHNLGQNFSKAFDINFQTRDGKTEYVWQTSWGMTTRSIGALVLVHGDDDGLVLPPKLAPTKLVIIPILGKDTNEKVLEFCRQVREKILSFDSEFDGKVEIWDNAEKTLGWKVNESELKGVPLRINIGERELSEVRLIINNRLSGSFESSLEELGNVVESELLNLQKELFNRAKRFLEKNTQDVSSYAEFKKVMETNRGFIKAFWCEGVECEKKIKEETKATTRGLPLDSKEEDGKCLYCDKESKNRWLFAQAY